MFSDKIKSSLFLKYSDKEIDSLLGINPNKVESELSGGTPETYIGKGLLPEALFTSYKDCYQILSSLQTRPGETLIDLGAGIGRMAITAALFFPHLKVKSIEIVKERLDLGIKVYKKMGLPIDGFINERFEKVDLQTPHYIFLYLPTDSSLKKVMYTLKKIEAPLTLIAIESHGDLLPSLTKNYPWLKKQKKTLKTFSKRWDESISFFKTIPELKTFLQEEKDLYKKIFENLEKNGRVEIKDIPIKWRHTFLLELSESKKYELVIEDQDIGMDKKYFWLASTYQLKNSLKNNYQANFPEREFSIEQISSIIKTDPSLNKWRELRFQDSSFYSFGKIRKIIISPKKSIEFSIKGRVLLDELNKNL
ncbi:hypothetical protein OAK75_02445 [Bacteriovoracales bacterium]|nr:hypothetical protein [Bacteriovoracales bacterium]